MLPVICVAPEDGTQVPGKMSLSVDITLTPDEAGIDLEVFDDGLCEVLLLDFAGEHGAGIADCICSDEKVD